MLTKELEAKILSEVDADRLLAHAEYITAEDRESGSPGEKRAAEYFRKVMTEQGLDVEINYVENFISLPIHGSLALQDGTLLESCITHSYGSSTTGLTSQAVFFDGTQDVKGKIAVMRGLASASPCKNLENKGALGIICITSGNYPYNMSISPIWGQPVPSTVGLLSKIPVVTVNSPDGEKLLASMEKGEDLVTITAEVSTKFRVVPISVAELKATKPTDKFIMFGGHMDSWHKGGADNGGANSVVIELARVFAAHRDELTCNIRFVWWSGHSNGRYSGSNWYADTHWEEIHDHCLANFDIDTVGTKGSNNFDHIECNKQCYVLGREVVAERTGQVPNYMRIQRNGDQSFWAHGVPTLFECLSLQPFEGAGKGTFMPGLPWYWHTTQDLFEHLGREELHRDAQIYAQAIARMTMLPCQPFSFTELGGEMASDLAKYQEQAGNAFDLSSVRAQVEKLSESFKKLDADIIAANETGDIAKAEAINELTFKLNRVLIPVHYCREGDLFQADLAITIPAFPEFDELPKLAAMDPASNEFKFLERQILRNRNRVYHFLKQGIELLQAAGY